MCIAYIELALGHDRLCIKTTLCIFTSYGYCVQVLYLYRLTFLYAQISVGATHFLYNSLSGLIFRKST